MLTHFILEQELCLMKFWDNMKKKDIKKFKRTEIRLKNINIDNPESFTDDESLDQKAKAQMKIAGKYNESKKSYRHDEV